MHIALAGRRRLAATVASLVVASLTAWLALRLSRAALEHEARGVLRVDGAAELAMARGAASWGTTSTSDYDTGSELFDSEWAFGAPAMRAACLAQVILRNPPADRELGPALDRAVAEVLSPGARAFSRGKWGSDPLDHAPLDHDHAAYYGYAGLAVGLASWAHPAWATERSRIADHLRARVRTAAWLETYPGESYPPDLAMGVAALALDEIAAGGVEQAPGPERLALATRLRGAVDARSGLLVQSVDPETGAPRDAPRGSGTFLAAYALGFADEDLASALYRSGRELRATRLGFVGMREHLAGTTGRGDIDSGPILLDLGVSATGFALAGARAAGDEATFVALDATARLFAVPMERDDGGVVSLAGGPLGDAILCAMRTAPTPREVRAWRPDARVSVKGGV